MKYLTLPTKSKLVCLMIENIFSVFSFPVRSSSFEDHTGHIDRGEHRDHDPDEQRDRESFTWSVPM